MTLVELVEKHMFFRRFALLWAMSLITIAVLRATDPTVLPNLTASGATVVSAVVGMLSVVVNWYQHQRGKEDAL